KVGAPDLILIHDGNIYGLELKAQGGRLTAVQIATHEAKNLKTGAEYTYSTSSVGGCRAVKHLVGAYSKQIQAAPETTAGHLPIVELGARSYKHPKKERGTIYNPVLRGVDWVHAAEIMNKPCDDGQQSLARDGETAPVFEDHRPKKHGRLRKS